MGFQTGFCHSPLVWMAFVVAQGKVLSYDCVPERTVFKVTQLFVAAFAPPQILRYHMCPHQCAQYTLSGSGYVLTLLKVYLSSPLGYTGLVSCSYVLPWPHVMSRERKV